MKFCRLKSSGVYPFLDGCWWLPRRTAGWPRWLRPHTCLCSQQSRGNYTSPCWWHPYLPCLCVYRWKRSEKDNQHHHPNQISSITKLSDLCNHVCVCARVYYFNARSPCFVIGGGILFYARYWPMICFSFCASAGIPTVTLKGQAMSLLYTYCSLFILIICLVTSLLRLL